MYGGNEGERKSNENEELRLAVESRRQRKGGG